MKTARKVLGILSLLLITLFSVGCSQSRMLLSSSFSFDVSDDSELSEIHLDTLPLQGCYHVVLRGSRDTYILGGRVASDADGKAVESAVRKQHPAIRVFNEFVVDESLMLESEQYPSALDESTVPLSLVQGQIAEVLLSAVPSGSSVDIELSTFRTLKISGELPSRRAADRLLYKAERVRGIQSVESELVVNGVRYFPEDQEFNLGVACAAAGLPTYQTWYNTLY